MKKKQKIANGKVKENNHGNIHNYDWHWRECLEYFWHLEKGSEVILQEIARRFKLVNEETGKPKNGGQLVKKFLINNNINLKDFKLVRADVKERAPRRAKTR